MPFELAQINQNAKKNPEAFAQECELAYNKEVQDAAKQLAERVNDSRIAFLSGPSSAGKTTTAKKICAELKRYSIHAHTISMDNYFLTLTPETTPRTPEGDYDRESPDIVDAALLNEHAKKLERGEEILKPYFNFKTQSRDMSRAVSIKLGPGEIVIFEGIHALNPALTGENPDSLKIYISTGSDVTKDGESFFKHYWKRLMRRVVRDEQYRATDALETLTMWPTVRRGEEMYISPFKHTADILVDSSMPYEISVLKPLALKAFATVPAGADPSGELAAMLPALHEFEEISTKVVPTDSILREFIGGGIFRY